MSQRVDLPTIFRLDLYVLFSQFLCDSIVSSQVVVIIPTRPPNIPMASISSILYSYSYFLLGEISGSHMVLFYNHLVYI